MTQGCVIVEKKLMEKHQHQLEWCGGRKAGTAMNGGAKNERRREVQLLLWSAEGDNSDSHCVLACALRPVAGRGLLAQADFGHWQKRHDGF
jgi:hypothetical protein